MAFARRALANVNIYLRYRLVNFGTTIKTCFLDHQNYHRCLPQDNIEIVSKPIYLKLLP